MNWHTGQFCRAAARYYATRQPVDTDGLRALWARARLFARLPSLAPPLTEAERAIAFAPPGETIILPHSGGLLLSIEGELLPDFPVTKHVEAIREAKGLISVRLNCPGGDLLAAFALHDALMAAGPSRTECLVAGSAGSAATLILAACGTRRALEGSRLWVHGPSDYVWGRAGDLRDAADQLDAWLPRMARVYERCCDPALVRQWLTDGGDHFFDAQQAVSVGLATEVVEPLHA